MWRSIIIKYCRCSCNYRLERCGFRVLCCTCDGLSVNRKFFTIHGDCNKVNLKIHTPPINDRWITICPTLWKLVETVGQVQRDCFGYVAHLSHWSVLIHDVFVESLEISDSACPTMRVAQVLAMNKHTALALCLCAVCNLGSKQFESFRNDRW